MTGVDLATGLPVRHPEVQPGVHGASIQHARTLARSLKPVSCQADQIAQIALTGFLYIKLLSNVVAGSAELDRPASALFLAYLGPALALAFGLALAIVGLLIRESAFIFCHSTNSRLMNATSQPSSPSQRASLRTLSSKPS